MKVKENVTLYICEFCSKKMQVKSAMTNHEEWCSKNPKNERACNNCSYLERKNEELWFDHPSGMGGSRMNLPYFYCNKLDKRLHPLNAVKKGLPDKFPEHFEESEEFPKECAEQFNGYNSNY